mgnify:FL=1
MFNIKKDKSYYIVSNTKLIMLNYEYYFMETYWFEGPCLCLSFCLWSCFPVDWAFLFPACCFGVLGRAPEDGLCMDRRSSKCSGLETLSAPRRPSAIMKHFISHILLHQADFYWNYIRIEWWPVCVHVIWWQFVTRFGNFAIITNQIHTPIHAHRSSFNNYIYIFQTIYDKIKVLELVLNFNTIRVHPMFGKAISQWTDTSR